MDAKAGRPAFDLKKELQKNGRNFSFFQAVRLLRFLIVRQMPEEQKTHPVREHVRMRPHLSLGHPSTEIEDINKISDTPLQYMVTANFLGLYGESSPLPAFYTEDLINEPDERDQVTRDFLDIFNYPLYYLFYEIWSKYRIPVKLIDEKNIDYRHILFSLLGLGVNDIEKDLPDPYRLLRYIGLLTQSPKSAKGLRTLLADALDNQRIAIIPAIKRRVRIPEEQRFRLGVSGNVLAEECYLGSQIEDRMGKYRVRIGPEKADDLQSYLPGKKGYEKIKSLSRLYLVKPYECELQVVLEKGELQQARLGETKWARLGEDTWIFSGQYNQMADVVFQVN